MTKVFSTLGQVLDHGFDTVIDVRSPAEFAEDRVPGAINLPVLDNEERARVGTIYKQQSPFLARKLGAALVFRNAAALWACGVMIDPGCCDPFYRKAIRVSVGAVLRTPLMASVSAVEMVEKAEAYGYVPLALTPGDGPDLMEMEPPARSLVLLGAEGPGLPPEVLARARPVRIPMASGFDSLNVAATSAIVLHHLTRR